MKRFLLLLIVATVSLTARSQDDEITPLYRALSAAKSQLMFEWDNFDKRLKDVGFVEQERKYYTCESDGVRAPFRWYTFGKKDGDYYPVEMFILDWSTKKPALFISYSLLQQEKTESEQLIIDVLNKMVDECVLHKQLIYTKYDDILDYERALIIDNRK